MRTRFEMEKYEMSYLGAIRTSWVTDKLWLPSCVSLCVKVWRKGQWKEKLRSRNGFVMFHHANDLMGPRAQRLQEKPYARV